MPVEVHKRSKGAEGRTVSWNNASVTHQKKIIGLKK